MPENEGIHQLTERTRCIILISEKGSGSTIFQDEISKHPQVRLVEHTEHNEHETQYWIKAACLLDMPADGFLHGKSLYERATAREKLIEFIASNVPGFDIPADDERLIFDGWSALCAQYGPVFFEKTPHHIQHWAALSLILRYIQTTDHDVRVIGLVRNPLAMVYSVWRSWASYPQHRQFIWRQSYRNLARLRDALASEQFLLVHYEDMANDPIGTMKKVCRFVDLPYCESIGQGIHRKSMEKWRTDPAYTLQLDESVKAMARGFGYTDQDLENPRKPISRFNPLNRLRSYWIRRMRLATRTTSYSVYPALKVALEKIGLWSVVRRNVRRWIG